jgi:hypothetical protein
MLSVKQWETPMSYEEGKTREGWGVFRIEPWHFAGLFETREAAEAKAREMGTDYLAKYGEHQAGTDNFVWSSDENPSDA